MKGFTLVEEENSVTVVRENDVRSVEDCTDVSRAVQLAFKLGKPVQLDLSQCEVWNGSLVGFLAHLSNQAEQSGIHFELFVTANSLFYELVLLTRIDRVVPYRVVERQVSFVP